jgi:hypothetical protein
MTRFTIVPTRSAVLAASALLVAASLGGCGDSTQAKHEKIIRCTGFSTALLNAGPEAQPTVTAAGQALTTKYGITENDTVPMGQAATTYSAGMDPARVTHLTDEGKTDATKLIAKTDPQGIADYTKSCVDTFRSLGR